LGRSAFLRSIFDREVVYAAVFGIRSRLLLPTLFGSVDGSLRVGLLRRSPHFLLLAVGRTRCQHSLFTQEGKRQEPVIQPRELRVSGISRFTLPRPSSFAKSINLLFPPRRLFFLTIFARSTLVDRLDSTRLKRNYAERTRYF